MKALAITLIALSSASADAQHIPAGSAVIEQAISQLVPAPLQATIDSRIPEDTILRWNSSSDWMRALQEATRAAGLRIQPNFDIGRINIMPHKTARNRPTTMDDTNTRKTEATAVTSAIPTPTLSTSPTAIAASVSASSFVLKPGHRIDMQFTEWAKQEGWSLIWTGSTWIVPGLSHVTYTGPVDIAIEQAVEQLYENGIPVRLEIWESNKIMEISHAK